MYRPEADECGYLLESKPFKGKSIFFSFYFVSTKFYLLLIQSILIVGKLRISWRRRITFWFTLIDEKKKDWTKLNFQRPFPIPVTMLASPPATRQDRDHVIFCWLSLFNVQSRKDPAFPTGPFQCKPFPTDNAWTIYAS